MRRHSRGIDGPRILFLVSSMEGGGAERVASILCNLWVNKGYQVTLMPTFSERGTCIYSMDGRVCVDYLADHVKKSRVGVWNRLERLIALRRIVSKEQPDVIVSFLTRVNVAAILATIGLRGRLIVTERNNPDYDPSGKVIRALRRGLYRCADTVVVQTQDSASWIRKYCGQANVSVIPNPIEMPLKVSGPSVPVEGVLKTDRKIVLAVGRLVEQKGFGTLLEAFGSVEGEGEEWDLVILGEGELRCELETKVREMGLQSRIHLPGRAGNLGEWYKRADIYVMSSLYEGFPNTLLEALAHGLPAISFDCKSGPAELIKDGSNGLLVAPESGPRGLAIALRSLMLDANKRQRMVGAALEATENYSWKEIDKKWTGVLAFSEATVD